MACSTSSGTSSGSIGRLQKSGSEEDLRQIMDQRKRKRMISNRESARRSRMKKQKQLDDSVDQVSQLTKENNQILTNGNLTTELYLKVEAENSVLRAQVSELTHRFQSLNDIINCLNAGQNFTAPLISPHPVFENDGMDFGSHDFMNPLDDWMYMNQSTMMGSSDLIMYS